MIFYIDCEWNDYKGELISMALVPEIGTAFYEEMLCKNPTDWVKENVIANLFQKPISGIDFQRKLMTYLKEFDSVHVIADWPEDIQHFCSTLILGPGIRIRAKKLSFEVIDLDITVKPKVPHNALSDAEAHKINHSLMVKTNEKN